MRPTKICILLFAMLLCSGTSAQEALPGSEAEGNSTQMQLYPISVKGKYGFIDKSGAVVIEPRFRDAKEFSEGLAKVTVPGLTEMDRIFEKNASGFIDHHGNFVIGPGPPKGYTFPERYDSYSYHDFHDGRARFWVGDSTGVGGYIDRKGKLVISPEFDSTTDFSEGLAFVVTRKDAREDHAATRSGFIDVNGKFVIENRAFEYAYGFVDGRCRVSVDSDTNKYGDDTVIDRSGKTIVPGGKYSISQFQHGLAIVAANRKVGAIDLDGNVVIPLEFNWLRGFRDADYTVGQKGEKQYIVDRKGELVCQIDVAPNVEIGVIKSGMAYAKQGNKYGYIDTTGKLAIPYKFDRAATFNGPLAKVRIGEIGGYIDKKGEFVWKTDRWDLPIRNSVSKPLSTFLPDTAIESLPLSYNWQGVKNAIVFASTGNLNDLRQWYKKRCSGEWELEDDSDLGMESSVMNLTISNPGILSFDVSAADGTKEDADGFIGFYACDNMAKLRKKYPKKIIGIIIDN